MCHFRTSVVLKLKCSKNLSLTRFVDGSYHTRQFQRLKLASGSNERHCQRLDRFCSPTYPFHTSRYDFNQRCRQKRLIVRWLMVILSMMTNAKCLGRYFQESCNGESSSSILLQDHMFSNITMKTEKYHEIMDRMRGVRHYWKQPTPAWRSLNPRKLKVKVSLRV